MRLNEFQQSIQKNPEYVMDRVFRLAGHLVSITAEAKTLGYSLEELASIAKEQGMLT